MKLVLGFIAIFTATAAFAQGHLDMATRTEVSGQSSSVVGGNDGSAKYAYAFQLPPSRGRFQPHLALSYNSNSVNSPVGVGWSLNDNYIDADPRNNSNGSRFYWLVQNGGRSFLAYMPSTASYAPDVSTSYLRVTFSSNSWTATDAVGNVSRYTCSALGGCTRWYLQTVTDVDGNQVSYTYLPETQVCSASTYYATAVGSQLLTQIQYNNVGSANWVHQVTLSYSFTPTQPQTETLSGCWTTHDKLLSKVSIQRRTQNGTTYNQLFSYGIAYTHEQDSGRDLLTGVQENGRDDTPLQNPTAYSYSAAPNSGIALATGAALPALTSADPSLLAPTDAECRAWLNIQPNNPSPKYYYFGICAISDVAAWIDMDGDGKPDLVWGGGENLIGGSNGIRWARNISKPSSGLAFDPVEVLPQSATTPWKGIITFGNPTGETTNINSDTPMNEVTTRLIDVNGDGMPDLVAAGGGTCTTAQIEVRLAVLDTGSRLGRPQFAAPYCVNATGPHADLGTFVYGGYPPVIMPLSATTTDPALKQTQVELADITGDGIVDFIVVSGANGSYWDVFPGAMNGTTLSFSPTSQKMSPSLLGQSAGTSPAIRAVDSATGSVLVDLVDLNGDGLLDRLVTSLPSPATGGGSTWTAEYNAGTGFAGGVIGNLSKPNDGALNPVSWTTPNKLNRSTLLDYNHDGRPDYVADTSSYTSSYPYCNGINTRPNQGSFSYYYPTGVDYCLPAPSGIPAGFFQPTSFVTLGATSTAVIFDDQRDITNTYGAGQWIMLPVVDHAVAKMYAVKSDGSQVVVWTANSNEFSTSPLVYNTALGTISPSAWDFIAYDWNGDGVPDLVGIHKTLTGSGTLEMHILSGAQVGSTPPFQTWLLHSPTIMGDAGAFGNTLKFAMADYNNDGIPDLFTFWTNNTAKTEIHIINGINPTGAWLLQIQTGLESFADGRYDLGLGSFNNDYAGKDLFAIKKGSTGSGKIEVHILSVASNYQTFVQHLATELPQDSVPSFRILNWPSTLSQYGSDIVRSTTYSVNVPARVTVLTSENNFSIPFYAPVAVVGRNGMFVDIDGDGALDYVSADPTNDAQTWTWYRGTQFDASKAVPNLLKTITTPLGAVTTLRYASSAEFGTVARGGAARNLVVQTSVSGPALVTLNTQYTYVTPMVGSLWFQPWRVEQLGFFESYTVDDATGNDHHYQWGNSHATAGQVTFHSKGVTTGGYLPFGSNGPYPIPVYNSFDRQNSTIQVRPLLGTGCLAQPDGTSAVSATNYPVITYGAEYEHYVVEGAATLQSSAFTACVDTAGNRLSVTFIPDQADNSTGTTATRQFTETRVFPSTGTPCVACVLEVYGTNTSSGAPSTDLYHRYYHYDGAGPSYLTSRSTVTTGHLNYVEQLVAGTGSSGTYEIASVTGYNSNGTVAQSTRNYSGQDVTSVVDQLAYDPNINLEVTQTTETDGVTSLIKSFSIDPQYGLLNAVVGPYLATPGPTSSYAYDKFNRVIATGFQGNTTTFVTYVPYVTGSNVPASTLSYSFATPVAFPPALIPTTDDVGQIVAYYDALGRNVQSRVRLGTGTVAAAGAQITQDLAGQYLVSNAVVLDGAGRVSAGLEPFYSSSASFADYHSSNSELATSGLHASRIGYDPKSRPVCSSYGIATNPLVAAPVTQSTCVSNLTLGSAAYARASFVNYTTDVLNSRTYLAVDAQPDWENTAGQSPWTPGRQYLDAAGRTFFARDQYQNMQQVTRDVLGRETTLTRFAGALGATPQVSDTKYYDLRGRLTKEIDGSRTRLSRSKTCWSG